ncbi:MAG: FAD-dependent oxidoreductase [Hoeflea sp.]|uniref:dihydrolipoyl dehydrogenase family protein n=1 Tax=Hoeflea sp. TaxID=1940281 RepID=UPI001D6FC79B|nr:FAD-dependent oxidoreductase [Hoeflea sp.]MBU4531379.1 FAD-dependent oxidoreductase [Alphaproteobacteria bacterium]MBU4544236.1 FAD-dependent oxidoreductase [Alphaproteobacteria bacterium]MBU4550527.1 FAD-dependent oxidoreductase [Alphaproteobacteria bacterium]MBV1724655.1 FAD-dependent oxidoreductase [Hoeflea sp.]MBV1760675.1 FAD-dependent oxidoreductase [Hoeflea sp.]
MTSRLTPDICIIGGGSGGLSVAAAAAAFGVNVVLIEKGRMGGDCLNYGCVPSKAMIAAGKHAHAIAQAPDFGVTAGEVKVNFRKVHDHIHSVIGAIAPNDSVERFRAMGVTVIEAEARFVNKTTVMAGDTEIRARRYVIATGSSPLVPPIPGLDTVDYLTNETLFEQTRAPKHLIIIGGGPIGVEMAQAHRRLGAEVTVVEGARALGKDDPELAAIVLDRIRAEGVTILEGSKVASVEKRGKTGVRVNYESEAGNGSVDGSDLLLAVGRLANVEGLGLDVAGVKHDRRGIKVGANLRSSNSRVYAIGDVAGGLQFTHVAGYHAGLVVQQILFRLPAKENRDIIPWATYTDPELAHVGLTEEEAAKRHGGRISILRWPYAENDRAQAERKTTGLIKMVVDRKARILGVSIAGAGAGEMINMWALALSNGMTLKDVRGYVPPYPTMAEIGKRAAITYYSPLTRKPFVRWIVRFLRRFG